VLYKAFISYNRAADPALAPALQSALERLTKPWYRVRCFRVFRDQTNLSVAPQLWGVIEQGLANAEFLILLASPGSASSRWVRRECEYWLEQKGAQTLLIALTDGAIVWDEATQDFDWSRTTAVPDILRNAFPAEPLYVDFRTLDRKRLSLNDPVFLDHVATLAATLHGRSKDEIYGEHIRQHRRTMRLAWSAVTVLVLLLAAATISAALAVNQLRRAERDERITKARALVAEALNAFPEAPPRALLLAAESVRVSRASGEPVERAAEAALHRLLSATDGQVLLRAGQPIRALVVSADGRTVVTGSNPGDGLQLWQLDGAGPRSVPLAGVPLHVADLALHADGHRLAALERPDLARPATGVVLWDLRRPAAETVRLRWPSGEFRRFLFHPDGHRLIALVTLANTSQLLTWDLDRPEVSPTLQTGHAGIDSVISPSPDRTTAVTVSFAARNDRPAPSVWLWRLDRAGEAPTALAGSDAQLHVAAFSADGHYVAAAEPTGFRVWDLSRPPSAPVLIPVRDRSIAALWFHPDGHSIVATGRLNQHADVKYLPEWVSAWNPSNPAQEMGLYRSEATFVRLALLASPGRWMAIPLYETIESLRVIRAVTLVDVLDRNTPDVVLRGHEAQIDMVQASRDGRRLYTADLSGAVRVWNLELPQSHPVVLNGHPRRRRVSSITFEGIQDLKVSSFQALTASSDGRWIATADMMGTVQVWDSLAPGALPNAELKSVGLASATIGFRPTGTALVVVTSDSVRLWEFARPDARPVDLVTLNRLEVVSLARLSRDSRTVLLATSALGQSHPGSPPVPERLRAFDLDHPSAPAVEFAVPAGRVTGLEFLPGGRGVVAAGFAPPASPGKPASHWLRVWDRQRPAEPVLASDLPAASPSGIQLVVDPAGHRVAWAGIVPKGPGRYVPTVVVADLRHPSAPALTLRLEGNLRLSLLFHPDGTRLLLTESDGTLIALDLEHPGGQPTSLGELEGEVTRLVLHPDGHRLAAARKDGTVLLADLADLEAPAVHLTGHQQAVADLAFLPGNRLVTAGNDDGTLHVWELGLDALLDAAARRAGRNLSKAEWKRFLRNEPYRTTFPGLPAPD